MAEYEFEYQFAGYVPMPCPVCDRQRLQALLCRSKKQDDTGWAGSFSDWFICFFECEKCEMTWGNDQRDSSDDHWTVAFGGEDGEMNLKLEKERWFSQAVQALLDLQKEGLPDAQVHG